MRNQYKASMREILMEEEEILYRPTKTPEIMGVVVARGPLE